MLVQVYWPFIVSSLAASCLVLRPICHLKPFQFNCSITIARWLPVLYSGRWKSGGTTTGQASMNPAALFQCWSVSIYSSYFLQKHITYNSWPAYQCSTSRTFGKGMNLGCAADVMSPAEAPQQSLNTSSSTERPQPCQRTARHTKTRCKLLRIS